MTCQNEKGYTAVIYRSSSHSCSESEDFLFNLEKLINQIKQIKPSFTIILGDFNQMISPLLMPFILFDFYVWL